MRSSPRWTRAAGSLILPACIVAAALTGCGDSGGGNPAGGGGSGGEGDSEERPVLRVGTEATFPPFESIDERGDFQGFDIDLIRAVGDAAGYTVEIRNLGFESLIPALQAGQIDVAASAMSITDARKEAVAFSTPYLEAGLVLTVPAGDTDIRGIESLRDKIVAVQTGATGATFAEELKADGRIADLKYFQTIPLAMMEVQRGGAAAMINDKPTSDHFVQTMPGFKVLPEILRSEPYGFAMKRGNDKLVRKVNDALARLDASGKLDELQAKWLAPTAEAAPATDEDEPKPVAGTQPGA